MGQNGHAHLAYGIALGNAHEIATELYDGAPPAWWVAVDPELYDLRAYVAAATEQLIAAAGFTATRETWNQDEHPGWTYAQARRHAEQNIGVTFVYHGVRDSEEFLILAAPDVISTTWATAQPIDILAVEDTDEERILNALRVLGLDHLDSDPEWLLSAHLD